MADLSPFMRDVLYAAATAEPGERVVVVRDRQKAADRLRRLGLVDREFAWQCTITPAGRAEALRRWPALADHQEDDR